MTNEASIACALTRPHGPFPYRRYTCVPNVDWGMGLRGEADFLALAPSGWLYEVEIKISVADLKRDAGKPKHAAFNREQSLVRGFWYAMPSAVWEKVRAQPPIPDHAGVILVDGIGSAVIRKPKMSKRARKLTAAEIVQLGRLGTMRYWTRLAHKLDVDGARALAAA